MNFYATKAPDPISFFGIDSDRWSIYASAATTVGLLVGALAAVIALVQFRHSRRIHREQTRPFMVITAEPSPASQVFSDLVVRNIGTTPAYDLTINVKPRLVRSREDMGYDIADARIFNDTISMWAPGYELRQYFDSHIEREGVRAARVAAGEPPLPEAFTATLIYYGSRAGRWFRRRERWEEKQVIDIELGRGTVYTDIYGIHHAAKALREIEKLVKSARLGDSPSHVITEDRDEYVARVKAEREERSAKFAEQRARLAPGAAEADLPAESGEQT